MNFKINVNLPLPMLHTKNSLKVFEEYLKILKSLTNETNWQVIAIDHPSD